MKIATTENGTITWDDNGLYQINVKGTNNEIKLNHTALNNLMELIEKMLS